MQGSMKSCLYPWCITCGFFGPNFPQLKIVGSDYNVKHVTAKF